MKRNFLHCLVVTAAIAAVVPAAIAAVVPAAQFRRDSAGRPGSSNSYAHVITPARTKATIRLVPSCGDPALDRAIENEVQYLEEFFDVRVHMAFYDDSASPQSFATNEQNEAGMDGVLFIGCALVNHTLAHRDQGRPGVAGILSHEMAHVLQFQRGFPTGLGGRAGRERQADFLAGYCLARQQQARKFDLKQVATSLYVAGDYERSHGTPAERVSAMLAGYRACDLSLDQAFLAGLWFALQFHD